MLAYRHWTVAIVFLSLMLATVTIATSISQIPDGQVHVPAASPSAICAPEQIAVRLPPTQFPPSEQPPFNAPPPYWIWGNWKLLYSSRPEYHQLANIQPDHYGIMPNETSPYGYQTDLTSWSNFANQSDPTIYTAFGFDQPRPEVGPIVFLFTGTGKLNISTYWELLGWGYDTNGIGFRVEYESQIPFAGYQPSINFSSREETGLPAATLAKLHKMLGTIFAGHAELSALLANVTAVPLDGRRTGKSPVPCGMQCIQNENIPPS